MKVEVDKLMAVVLARLDESVEILDDGVEYGSPDFDLRELIKSLLAVEAERLLVGGDIAEVAEWVPMSGEVAKVSSSAGTTRAIFTLPDDFLRFVYLRMSDWSEEVTELMLSGEKAGDLRRHWEDRYGKGYGSPGLMLVRHDGKRALEVFGTVPGSRVAEGGYLPRLRIEGDVLIFPSSLFGALTDQIVETIKGIRR
ncbi:MAG: hypothetical protein K2H76_01005 [Muribaculaceae bacterium]|nr:hypothetical protein [Muribaculaceae bacterium]